MQITDIRVTKRGRIAIDLDGEFALTLPADLFAQSHLRRGEEIAQERLDELWQEAQAREARERALRLLSSRAYTKKQLEDKLSRVCEEEAVSGAVERMEELGLLDDQDYALRSARDLRHFKHYSSRRIAQELRQKGIGEAEIEEALSQFEDDDPREELAKVLLRRYPAFSEDEKVRRRAVGALTRLGYSYEDIRYVMAHAEEYREET